MEKQIEHGGAFMLLDELAAELRVTPARARRLIHTGAIPAVRMAGRLMVPRQAWRLWLQGRTQEAIGLVSVQETESEGGK